MPRLADRAMLGPAGQKVRTRPPWPSWWSGGDVTRCPYGAATEPTFLALMLTARPRVRRPAGRKRRVPGQNGCPWCPSSRGGRVTSILRRCTAFGPGAQEDQRVSPWMAFSLVELAEDPAVGAHHRWRSGRRPAGSARGKGNCPAEQRAARPVHARRSRAGPGAPAAGRPRAARSTVARKSPAERSYCAPVRGTQEAGKRNRDQLPLRVPRLGDIRAAGASAGSCGWRGM